MADPKKKPKLTADQRRAIQPDRSVWVGASAGSGKTHVLSNRVLRLLLEGASPMRLLCLTFTKAAAAQMANRIHQRLASWAVAPTLEVTDEVADLLGREPTAADMIRARQLFADVLDTPGGLKIQTIHSFCQMVLARFPLEAGVSPGATAIEDRRQAELLAEVGHRLMTEMRHQSRGTDEFDAFVHLTQTLAESTFDDLGKTIVGQRGRWQAALMEAGSVDGVIDRLARLLDVTPGQSVDDVLAAGCANLGGTRMWVVLGALSEGSKNDIKAAERLRPFMEASGSQRVELFVDYYSAFFTTDHKMRKTFATASTVKVLPDANDIMLAEAERVLALKQKLAAIQCFTISRAVLIYGYAVLGAYEAAKRREAVLDFEDLISAVHRLLTRTPSVAPWVLYKLDGGLDHLLVDEAQDTSPQQWAIVSALVDEFYRGMGQHEGPPRTLFVVGDIKQSIFSFQGADSDMFVAMQDWFARQHAAAERPMDPVPLDRSFRSSPVVLAVVDAVFARGQSAAYGVALPDRPVQHEAAQVTLPGRVELWPLILQAKKPEVPAWDPPLVQRHPDNPQTQLAQAVAQHIRGLLDSGARRPGDIMILVRSRNAFFEAMSRALKALEIPVAGQDRLTLNKHIAIQDLLSMAQFLLLPSDDLSLAEVLKSPLVGLSEDQLFELAHGRDTQNLWQVVLTPTDAEWREAVRVFLATQLARADLMTPFDLFTQMLTADGGRARFIARLGLQVEDILDEFLSLALQYELDNAPSLQGFVHWFTASETVVKRDMEQARDEVRIMTVHGAKGLEAPVVYVPDTTSVPSVSKEALMWLGDDPALPVWRGSSAEQPSMVAMAQDQWKQATQAESHRLLYVALTRAEQHVIVAGVATTKAGAAEGSWYAAIQSGLEAMDTAEVETPVGTGRMVESADWGMAAQQARGLDKAMEGLPAWFDLLAPEEPTPSSPLTPSRPDEENPAARSPLAGYETDETFLKDPYLRGRLIHALLEMLPTVPPGAQEDAAYRYLSTPAYGLSPPQINEMTATTLDTLHHPDFAPVFGPSSRAEVPIAGLVANRALSGQIDRLVVTPDHIFVVDFKTNRPAPRRVEDVAPVYLRQMAVYRAALQGVYGDRPITCALLWTDGPHLMPLDADLLDAHFSPT